MFGLHTSFEEFAKALGYTTIYTWSKSAQGSLRGSWKQIKNLEAQGISPHKALCRLVLKLVEYDGFYGSGSFARSRRRFSYDEQIKRVNAMYPKLPAKSKKNPSKGMGHQPVRIGLGLESTYKQRKVDRDSVVIDEHTEADEKPEKSILYTAGWSAKGAFTDDED
ncbi:hypothetical protein NP572_19675 [Pseudomonas putida]|uniref:hypothetical protein n=1 Tax=Pseudomonas putida TaxID=303 RepID=UPI002363C638|nr:hypothetical protein [Pseudomonas putida]MDD2038716.1 hypothetical protein [Pseudomonas putida]MDD2044339.1 hypothetical protein [Pseudomonas putida]